MIFYWLPSMLQLSVEKVVMHVTINFCKSLLTFINVSVFNGIHFFSCCVYYWMRYWNFVIRCQTFGFYRFKPFLFWGLYAFSFSWCVQLVVERMLASEGIKRMEMSRDEFTKRVWEWKEKYVPILLSFLKIYAFVKSGLHSAWWFAKSILVLYDSLLLL